MTRFPFPWLALAGALALVAAAPSGPTTSRPGARPAVQAPGKIVRPDAVVREDGNDEPERRFQAVVHGLAAQDHRLYQRLVPPRAAQGTYPVAVKLGLFRGQVSAPVRPHRAPGTLHDTRSFDRPGVAKHASRLIVLCLLQNGQLSPAPGAASVCGNTARVLRLDRASGTVSAVSPLPSPTPRAATPRAAGLR